MRSLRPLLAAAAFLPSALVAGPAFQTIDMLAVGAGNASMAGVGNLTLGAFPFGSPTSLGNVPFIVTQLNNQVWAADTAAPGSAAQVTQTFTMPVNDIYGFYTVANTYWGDPFLSVIDYTFNFTDATSYTYTLTNGVDIRDFNSATNFFANTLNDVTSVNVYADPVTSTVLDRQFIDLDAVGFGGKDLASFTITDRGGSGISRIFLVAATAQTGAAGQVPVEVITTVVDEASPLVWGASAWFRDGTFAPNFDWPILDVIVLAGATGTLDSAGGSITVGGSVDIGAGSTLILAGVAGRGAEVWGGTLGAGSLLVTGGDNVLRAAGAHAGGTTVQGGSLTLADETSLPSTGNVVMSGGSVLLPNSGLGAGTVRVYDQSFSIVGTGPAAGAGAGAALVLGTALTPDSMRLDGALTLTGDATVRFEGMNGTQAIAGGVDASSAGFTLTLEVAAGAGGELACAVGGTNVVPVVKTGGGTLGLASGATLTSGLTVSEGMVVVRDVASLQSSGNVVISGATLSFYNAGVGSMSFTQALSSGSAVSLFGNATVALAANPLGDVRFAGELTLVGDTTLLADGGQCLITGPISGGAGKTLVLNAATGSLVIDNGVSGAFGLVQKIGTETLVLAAGSGLVSDVEARGGVFSVNGSLTGDVTVLANAVLGGSGRISGDVTVLAGGTLAPGNSPGVLVLPVGDVTFDAGSGLSVELGGALPGNGDGYHDQLVLQSGSVTILPGAVLQASQWAQPSLFTPVRGDVMTVITATGGIAGGFDDFVNQSYATWLLYDNSLDPSHTRGRIYGTGLVRGQSFAFYSAQHAVLLQRIWEDAVAESPDSMAGGNPAGFIRSDTGTGFGTVTLLSAPTVEDGIALLGPGAHLAADDYVFTVMRSVQDAGRQTAAVYQEGPWTVVAGYARAEHRHEGAAREVLNHSLVADGAFAALTRRAGGWDVGVLVASNDGSTVYSAGRADYSGAVFGLSASGRVQGRLPMELRLSAVWAGLSMDASRNQSVARDVSVDGLGAQLWAEFSGWSAPRWSLSPVLGFTYGRSEVEGFTETGGMPMVVDPFDASSSCGYAGLVGRYKASESFALTLAAGLEHEFQGDRSARGVFIDLPAAGPYPEAAELSAAENAGASGQGVFSLGAAWGLPHGVTLSATAEFRAGGAQSSSRRFNLALGRRF